MSHKQTTAESLQQQGTRTGSSHFAHGLYIGEIDLATTGFYQDILNVFVAHKRYNVRVRGSDGEWHLFESVPVLTNDNALIHFNLATDKQTVLVGFFGESHTASSAVILGFVNPSYESKDTNTSGQSLPQTANAAKNKAGA